MKTIIYIAFAALLPMVLLAEHPKAPEGYKWRKFRRTAVELRVPKDWNVYEFEQGRARNLQITKEKKTGKGFDTGLTVQYIPCKSTEEYSDAITQAGEFMANLYKEFTEIEEATSNRSDDRLDMTLQGKRKIPERMNDKIYKTRTRVLAFHEAMAVYIFTFGYPTDEEEEGASAWEVMSNPILFLDAN